MKFKESLVIKNPFKMYRYEVVGAYRDFIFSEAQVPLRPSLDEDGYDDVTDYDTFNSFSDEIKHRFLPFLRKITEEEYIANNHKYVFEDMKTTQSWAGSPSSNLLSKITNGPLVEKISENIFIEKVINYKHKRKDGKLLTIDDVESLELSFEYFYNRKNDSVFVMVSNIKFNCDVEPVEKEYDTGFYVPDNLIEFYFGINRMNSKGHIVNDLLQKEFLFTPAMIFESSLYLKIKDKIKEIEYRVSQER
jgi:hypothetical protein